MAELGPVTRALLAIARDVPDDRALARLVCEACVSGLNVDGAALSLLTASVARRTLHATDATGELLEELQFTLNEGACIEAATTGVAVFVDDLQRSELVDRWPIFTSAVLEKTLVRAVFALPLQWGTVSLGVLDLYRRAPLGLNNAQRSDALAAADTAALMMLTLKTDPDHLGDGTLLAERGGSWLDSAVASRAEIHQATGMVLAQLGLTAADALARMRAHAFVHDRLLIDVAHDVLAKRLTFTIND
jgi:hypothetical protein